MPDVAWSYETPYAECQAIASHLSFDETKIGVEAALPIGPTATPVPEPDGQRVRANIR